jgi:hypothetical protein
MCIEKRFCEFYVYFDFKFRFGDEFKLEFNNFLIMGTGCSSNLRTNVKDLQKQEEKKIAQEVENKKNAEKLKEEETKTAENSKKKAKYFKLFRKRCDRGGKIAVRRRRNKRIRFRRISARPRFFDKGNG